MVILVAVESRRYALTGAQLFVAEFENKRFINHRKIAGQHTKESISQPRWGPDGILYFASDRSGYYKLYRIKDFNSEIEILGPTGLCNHERVEFSSPEWRLGARTYVNLTPNLIVATYLYQAGSGLATIDINTNKWTDLPTDYVEISYINVVSETKFIVCGSTATSPKEVVELDIKDSSYRRVIAKSTSLELSSGIFSRGRSIVFTRSNGTHAYAWLWSPHNPKHKDLNGKWGELDASDASAFARHMCGEACPEDIRAFPDQVDITGGSAGGYTVLRALTVNDFPWTAGVSLCGIGNITMLEADTHKFESRYTRILLDPAGKTLTEEERSEIYHDKSPQFFADRITAATLLLQGNEDKVVLLHQAKDMTREIERAGQIVKLVVYEGEGHGFRKAESIKDMLGQMELWWSKYLVRP